MTCLGARPGGVDPTLGSGFKYGEYSIAGGYVDMTVVIRFAGNWSPGNGLWTFRFPDGIQAHQPFFWGTTTKVDALKVGDGTVGVAEHIPCTVHLDRDPPKTNRVMFAIAGGLFLSHQTFDGADIANLHFQLRFRGYRPT